MDQCSYCFCASTSRLWNVTAAPTARQQLIAANATTAARAEITVATIITATAASVAATITCRCTWSIQGPMANTLSEFHPRLNRELPRSSNVAEANATL